MSIRVHSWFLQGAILVFLLASAHAVSFDRYNIIIQRKPFGEAPPEPVKPPPPKKIDDWAKHLRLHSFYDLGDGWRVGIEDKKNKNNYDLGVGETTETDIELDSVDFDEDGEIRVVVKKGEDRYELRQEAEPVIAPAVPKNSVMSRRIKPSRRRQLEELRRKRQEEERRQRRENPVFPTKEALDKHLMDYQMNLIRAGGELGPVLPVPLSPEADAQLVSEGVLPPLDPTPGQ